MEPNGACAAATICLTPVPAVAGGAESSALALMIRSRVSVAMACLTLTAMMAILARAIYLFTAHEGRSDARGSAVGRNDPLRGQRRRGAGARSHPRAADGCERVGPGARRTR